MYVYDYLSNKLRNYFFIFRLDLDRIISSLITEMLFAYKKCN